LGFLYNGKKKNCKGGKANQRRQMAVCGSRESEHSGITIRLKRFLPIKKTRGTINFHANTERQKWS